MAVLKKGKKSLGNFEVWNHVDVENLLGVLETETPEFNAWMKAKDEMPIEVWEKMQFPIQRLKYFVSVWNEMELRTQFISNMLDTVCFAGKNFNYYENKSFAIDTPKLTVKGTADWMCARGDYEPDLPYFFLHEYKRKQGTGNDELGQLLIEMYTAEVLNPKKRGIFGCTIVGVYWHFIFLKDKKYSVSDGLDVSKLPGFTKIWQLLTYVKQTVTVWADEDTLAMQEQANNPKK